MNVLKNINHYYQDDYYTCGPASFRMVLSAFDMDVSEADLVNMMNTSDVYGTHYKDLIGVGDNFGLKVRSGDNGTFDLLDDMVADGWVVILAYSLDVPHFAVYMGNNGNHLYLNDPHLGEKKAFLMKKFMKKWLVDRKLYKRYATEFKVDFPSWWDTKGWWVAFKK